VEAMSAFDDALSLLNSLELMNKARPSQFKVMDRRVENGLLLGKILHNIGKVCFRVGSYGKALISFEQSATLQKQTLGDDHPDIATVMHSIGIAQREMGHPMEAMTNFRKSHEIRVRVFGDCHELVAQSLFQIGSIHDIIGSSDEALKAYEETLRVEKNVYGDSHLEVVTTMSHIGQVYHNIGNIEKALEVYREMLSVMRKRLGDDSNKKEKRKGVRHMQRRQPSIFAILNTIGNLYLEQGNRDEALVAFTEVGEMLQDQAAAVPTTDGGIDDVFLLFALHNSTKKAGFLKSFPSAAAA